MTNLIASTTSKIETRGRKFNVSQHAIKRAWEISKNATVAHNTNPLNVAKKGLVKPSEFFSEALKIGWVEAKMLKNKTQFEAYKLHTVPKKNLGKILTDIAAYLVTNELVVANDKDSVHSIITKGSKVSTTVKYDLATHIFYSRFSTPAAQSTNRQILKTISEYSVNNGMVQLLIPA